MNFKRKITSLILAGAMIISGTVSASASSLNQEAISYGLTADELANERDQVGNGSYMEFAPQFEAAGLTYSDVKSLQNAGFSYVEILQMGSGARSALPRRARATRPSTFVKVTNVGGSTTEYYHPSSGMVTGDFYEDNDGGWIEDQLEYFIEEVYGSTSNMTYMYYLFGEWDNSFQTHQGTDMRNTSSNPKLYAACSGDVTTTGTTGRIAIYDGDVTHFYAHCSSIQVSAGDYVEYGDYIGNEGSVGASTAHLHYEVRDGEKTSMGLQNTSLNSLNPYDYM